MENTKNKLVVTGYCRSIQKLLYEWDTCIPLTLIELCIEFYGGSCIITVALGQCGIAMNQMLFESIQIMNQSNTDHPTITDTYCRRSNTSLTARSMVIDLEPGTLDMLKTSSAFCMYEPSSLIFGASDAGHNWAKGHYTEGAEKIDECVEALQTQIEAYDTPQGIHIFHGLGGGTGAGMGTLLMAQIKDHYPDLDIMSFSVFPAPKSGGCVVRPYNTVLSLYQMDEFCDGTFVIDNESLWDLAHYQLKLKQPRYSDLNFITNQVVDDITSLFRFDDTYGFTMRSFLNEMVQFPRLKYFTTARAPFYKLNGEVEQYHEVDLISKLFESKHRSYAHCDIRKGMNLSTVLLYRNTKERIVSKEIGVPFAREVISTVIKEPPRYNHESVAIFANSTSVKAVLQRMATQFHAMYKRKAFLHWYKGEGMDEMEFDEAYQSVLDTINEYIQKDQQNGCFDT